jgi:putative FmdB family regulatory protein
LRFTLGRIFIELLAKTAAPRFGERLDMRPIFIQEYVYLKTGGQPMPIYEFHCAACNETFEKLSRMSQTEQPCPRCGAPSAKAISVPARGKMGAAAGAPACAASCGKASGFS